MREKLPPCRDALRWVEDVGAETGETGGGLVRVEAALEVAPEARGNVRGVQMPGLGSGRAAQSSSAETACGNWSSRTYTRYPNAPRPSVTPVDA